MSLAGCLVVERDMVHLVVRSFGCSSPGAHLCCVRVRRTDIQMTNAGNYLLTRRALCRPVFRPAPRLARGSTGRVLGSLARLPRHDVPPPPPTSPLPPMFNYYMPGGSSVYYVLS